MWIRTDLFIRYMIYPPTLTRVPKRLQNSRVKYKDIIFAFPDSFSTCNDSQRNCLNYNNKIIIP